MKKLMLMMVMALLIVSCRPKTIQLHELKPTDTLKIQRDSAGFYKDSLTTDENEDEINSGKTDSTLAL